MWGDGVEPVGWGHAKGGRAATGGGVNKTMLIGTQGKGQVLLESGAWDTATGDRKSLFSPVHSPELIQQSPRGGAGSCHPISQPARASGDLRGAGATLCLPSQQP